MTIGPLLLLHRMKGGGLLVASLHWPWSVCWRWIFVANWHRKMHRLGFYYSRNNKHFWCAGWNNRLLDFRLEVQASVRRPPPHWLHPIEDLVNELEL